MPTIPIVFCGLAILKPKCNTLNQNIGTFNNLKQSHFTNPKTGMSYLQP